MAQECVRWYNVIMLEPHRYKVKMHQCYVRIPDCDSYKSVITRLLHCHVLEYVVTIKTSLCPTNSLPQYTQCAIHGSLYPL